jgi:transcriptional regulator with XRE-family HTH domain
MQSRNSLRQRRREAGLTQVELAERAGVTQQYVSLVERDNYFPPPKTQKALAAALQLPIRDVFQSLWSPEDEAFIEHLDDAFRQQPADLTVQQKWASVLGCTEAELPPCFRGVTHAA